MKKALSILAAVALLSIAAIGQNQSVSKTITLQVVPAVSITTTTIPPGVVSQAYTTTLTAAGGVAPYTWTATLLPTWLTLSANGVLSGTIPNSACTAPVVPATTCPFTFTVTVTDNTGSIAKVTVNSSVLAKMQPLKPGAKVVLSFH